MTADPITVDQGTAGVQPGHSWPVACPAPCTACTRDDEFRRGIDLDNLGAPIALTSPPPVDGLLPF